MTLHGCPLEVYLSILDKGPLALHRGDGGYFGKGVYTTPSLEYAARYATGELATITPSVTPAPVSPTDPPQGCYPVLLCAAGISMAYAITKGETDYPKGSKVSKFYSTKGTPSKGLQVGAETHVVPVSEGLFFQAAQDARCADYFELVHERNELVLPMGVVWVKKK